MFSEFIKKNNTPFYLLNQHKIILDWNLAAQKLGKDILQEINFDLLQPHQLIIFQNEKYKVHIVPSIQNDHQIYLTIILPQNELISDEKSLKKNEDIDKLKNDLISVVSHELRTPLAIVKGSLENLKMGMIGELSEKQEKILHTSLRNVDRLGKIIHNLLDLSMLEAGVSKIYRRKLHLLPIIEEIKLAWQEEANQKKLHLKLEVSPQVPNVLADEKLIRQVLNRLLENAFYHAQNKILIKLSKKQDQIRVLIRDDGPGIQVEDKENVFDKFMQINRPKGGAGYKGAGLGLSIAKEIIDKHQGEISFEENIEQGCSIFFTLPVYEESDVLQEELEKFRFEADHKKEPFTLMTLFIQDWKQIKKSCSEKQFSWMLADLNKSISSILRPSDVILEMNDGKGFYVLLSGADQKKAFLVTERIHLVTKDCFCPGQNGKIYIQLKVGSSVYPNDTAYLNKLVEYSLEKLS